MTYKCACCGEVHDELPDLSFDRPSYASDVPDSEFDKRVKLNEDLCVVDREFYFIRGVIQIPIRCSEQYLGFGVWVSLKKENFETYLNNYDTPDIGPFFGWLSNEFKFGGKPTLNLKTMANFQGNGQRPLIELDESDHPLYIVQRDCISIDKAWKIVHDYLG